jgi:hypothetical protein
VAAARRRTTWSAGRRWSGWGPGRAQPHGALEIEKARVWRVVGGDVLGDDAGSKYFFFFLEGGRRDGPRSSRRVREKDSGRGSRVRCELQTFSCSR